MTRADLTVRPAGAGDEDAVLAVCARALQWAGDGGDAAFFHWKHRLNHFGSSPVWVAEDLVDGQPALVGVRVMMLWELLRPSDGTTLRMARAVDTATLPSHQGRGIFSTLTMAAVDALTREGRHAIFNTPNAKSGPGYLKMGWSSLGRVPVRVRPRRPGALVAMTRGRTAAERWGLPCDVGLPPSVALADQGRIEALLASVPKPARWHTPVSVGYLRWRSGFEPLQCRFALIGSEVEDGLVLFRVRQRGGLRQLSLLHVLAPARGPSPRRAIGRLLKATGSDLAMATGAEAGLGAMLAPVPRIGPELLWRPLADPGVPSPADLSLPLGALELF
ncbi:MAG: GNAT family N-acetyltransferase [Acidimicrobiales bacterium]